MNDFSLEPQQEDKPVMASVERQRPTKAMKRALLKAHHNGFVMRAGAFSGDTSFDVMEHPQFDRALIVDRCVAQGWLTFGEGYNQHVLTDRGASALA